MAYYQVMQSVGGLIDIYGDVYIKPLPEVLRMVSSYRSIRHPQVCKYRRGDYVGKKS